MCLLLPKSLQVGPLPLLSPIGHPSISGNLGTDISLRLALSQGKDLEVAWWAQRKAAGLAPESVTRTSK